MRKCFCVEAMNVEGGGDVDYLVKDYLVKDDEKRKGKAPPYIDGRTVGRIKTRLSYLRVHIPPWLPTWKRGIFT